MEGAVLPTRQVGRGQGAKSCATRENAVAVRETRTTGQAPTGTGNRELTKIEKR